MACTIGGGIARQGSGQVHDLLNDPHKLLELIAAAQGAKGDGATGTEEWTGGRGKRTWFRKPRRSGTGRRRTGRFGPRSRRAGRRRSGGLGPGRADRAAEVQEVGPRTSGPGGGGPGGWAQVQAVSVQGRVTRRRNRRRWASDRHVDRNWRRWRRDSCFGSGCRSRRRSPGGRGEPTEEELLGILGALTSSAMLVRGKRHGLRRGFSVSGCAVPGRAQDTLNKHSRLWRRKRRMQDGRVRARETSDTWRYASHWSGSNAAK